MTFSRIRCLTGHFVDRTLDPPEGSPLGATGYTNHEVDKGLVSVIVCGWFATIILKSSKISHFVRIWFWCPGSCQGMDLSGILILDWLLTLNKMVTRPWSHFKFNLFCDSVTSTTINLVDCILSQYFVTLLIKIMFWDHTGIYRKLGPGIGREQRWK